MSNKNKFLTKESFSEKIEEMVLTDGYTHFEAIIAFADDCNRDPDDMLPMMTQVLLEKVRQSAQKSGLIDLKQNDLDSFCG